MTENPSAQPLPTQPLAADYEEPVQGQPGSKTEAAKGEARGVANEAASAGHAVADVTKGEARNVAHEAKYQARDLMNQTRQELTDQAATQQRRAAEGLRSIHQELSSMARNSQEQGLATDLVRQAAGRAGSFADWLDNRDPGSLLDEVKAYARRRPGAFLAIAAGAGLLAGRLTRSLAAGSPDTSPAARGYGQVPPRPAYDAAVQPGAGYQAAAQDRYPEQGGYPAQGGYAEQGGYPAQGGYPEEMTTAGAGGRYEADLAYETDPVYDPDQATRGPQPTVAPQQDIYPPAPRPGSEQR